MGILTIQIHVPDDKEAAFNGRDLLVIPVTAQERDELGQYLTSTLDFLKFLRRSLSTLQQILESDGDKEGRIAKTYNQLSAPSASALGLHDRALEMIGRGVFVTPAPKGPVQ